MGERLRLRKKMIMTRRGKEESNLPEHRERPSSGFMFDGDPEALRSANPVVLTRQKCRPHEQRGMFETVSLNARHPKVISTAVFHHRTREAGRGCNSAIEAQGQCPTRVSRDEKETEAKHIASIWSPSSSLPTIVHSTPATEKGNF